MHGLDGSVAFTNAHDVASTAERLKRVKCEIARRFSAARAQKSAGYEDYELK
jgi:hypothetical protein